MTCCLYTSDASINCCPAEVAVSITNNIIEIGEATLQGITEVTTLTGTTWNLSHSPWNPGFMQLFVGGSIQAYGTDYVIGSTGNITFLTSDVSGQAGVAIYQYLDSTSGVSVAGIGTAQPLMVDDPEVGDIPSGYLLLDGGLLNGEDPGTPGCGYSRTTFAALYAVVGDSLGDGDGSTTFADEVFQTVQNSGGQLVAFYTVIKY